MYDSSSSNNNNNNSSLTQEYVKQRNKSAAFCARNSDFKYRILAALSKDSTPITTAGGVSDPWAITDFGPMPHVTCTKWNKLLTTVYVLPAY